MRRLGLALLLVAAAMLPTKAFSQAVYAASIRNSALAQGEAVPGSLYAVQLGSATATFLSSIYVDGKDPVGVTGLAIHPTTGVMYGITPKNSPKHPQSLITVDPSTGRAAVIGSMRHAGSDIAFTREGVLYAWLPGQGQLAWIDLTSANLTLIGPARGAGPPAGLSIDPEGSAYITSGSAGGTLDRIDLTTGTITPGPQMSGAPFPAGVNSMSFTPSGLLLAVNTNGGSPASTRLVSINTATGKVATMGDLPDDTDALTFTPQLRRGDEGWSLRGVVIALISVFSAALGAVAVWLGRRR